MEERKMKVQPALDECKKIAAEGGYGVIPVSTEIYSDTSTPIEVLRTLKNVSSHVYLLESARADEKWGRYSFLGYDPLLEITCYNGKTTVKGPMTSGTTDDDVRNIIRDVLKENKAPKLEGLPAFTGGLVGYFSYDYIKYSEPSLKLDADDEEGFKDVNLMLFDRVIAFDNYRQKIILIINIKTDELEVNYKKAVLELENMKKLIRNGSKAPHIPLKITDGFKPLFDENEYCDMVNRAKHYIKEGDIFQVVLSNRFEAGMEGSLLDAYRVLRTTNPSPYMFYFSGSDGEIAGASPETLVKLENEKLYTFPLAGTRRRGGTEEEDKELERELLADEKERAEHNMLVDLGRNDIGKISRIGTVQVEKYMSVNPDIKVIRNDELTVEEIEKMSPDHIVLSPGPGKPSDAGICEEVIKYFAGKIPIMGICLGHQAICEVFGARVTYAKKLMHGKQSVASLDTESRLFKNMNKEITVARYHSLAADPESIPECLRVTAKTSDGEIMAVEHIQLPIYGVQFHPESVLTPEGRQIIANFFV